MMYSAYKLNKQGDIMQSWHTPFPNLETVHCSMPGSNYCFLTCIQISQEVGQMLWHSHPFKNFPQFVVLHAVKDFNSVNEAEVDVFLELSCFFDDWTDVGSLISGSSAFSKSILNIWKFSVHVLLKPLLENFEHCFARVWDECNHVVVWTLFDIAFFGVEWKLIFSSPVATAEFSKFSGILREAINFII